MIPNDVLDAFNILCSPEKPLVWIATSKKDEPHLVPVCFVKPLKDGRLIIGNVFIKKTEQNIRKNPKISVGVAFKRGGWEGYLLKGRAEILSTGTVYEDFKKEVLEKSNGRREINSAILVSIDKVYSLAPMKGDKKLF